MRAWHRPTPKTTALGRAAGARTALVAGLALTLIAWAASPARADDPVENPGPEVSLPFFNRLFPNPTTGGPGTDALNDLVAQECNDGGELGEQQWFTLPSEGSGLLFVLARRQYWYGAGRSPDTFPGGAAVVDHGTGEVLGCGTQPLQLGEGGQRSIVAWSDPDQLNNCYQQADECSPEPLEVFANWTGGPPANDRWQDAKPITAVPFQDATDTALASQEWSVPVLTPYCIYSYVDPVEDQSVWWTFTPSVSGALPLSAAATETYGPPGNQPVFGPHVSVGRLTGSGPEPLPYDYDRDCDGPPRMVEVEAGTTYLVSLHDYYDPYYGSDLVHGGRATLSVGALRPTPPLAVTATPGDGEIVLTWSPSEHAGSSAITGYRVEQDGVAHEVPAGTTTYTADGLTNGREYSFVVTALNSAGPGNPAAAVQATPDAEGRLPGPPTDVHLEIDPKARTATLTWSPPTVSDTPITDYAVQRTGTDSAGSGLFKVLPGSARSFTLEHLRASTDYEVTLWASNESGVGAPYSTDLRFESDTLSRPVRVTAERGVREVTVTWGPPDDSVGTQTGYRVRTYVGGGTDPVKTTTVGATTGQTTITGLTPGTAYTFDVTAANVNGLGEPSFRTAPVTPIDQTDLPSEPTSVQATQGVTTGDRGTATLTWQPPASDGGSAITGYRVSRDGKDVGGAGPWSTTLPASARSHTFTHLNIWDTYTLSVEAITDTGAGPAATRSVTIEDPRPSAPTSVAVTAGNASATVTWQLPEHGDKPVTGYRIRTYVGQNTTEASSKTVGATPRSYTVTSLTNGKSYRFDVTAINAAGTGRASARTTAVTPAVPVTAPGAPKIGTASPGTPGGAITATATWSPPSSTGGSAITGYKVTALRVDRTGKVLDSTVSAVQPASARSLSMTLPKTGRYQFTVQAVNAVGTGPASARSNTVDGS